MYIMLIVLDLVNIITVYIDLNHNGEFNEGEPYNYTNIFGEFEFNNLNPEHIF